MVLTDEGLVELGAEDGTAVLRVALRADDVRAFAVAPDGGVWISRADQWALERCDLAGTQTDRVPIPAPTASALHLSGRLWVGTERWSLSAAQLKLAPLAGSPFALDPTAWRRRHRHDTDKETPQ